MIHYGMQYSDVFIVHAVYIYIYPIYPTHTHQVHWTRAMKPRLWCALLSLWQWRAFFSVHQNGTSLKIVVVNYQIC